MRVIRVARRSIAMAVMVTAPAVAAQRAPSVDVWFEHGNQLERGASAPLRYATDGGDYVTIVRIDTDGRMSVLAPAVPGAPTRFRGGRDGAVVPFRADAADGVGYVFAIASSTPFDFRSYRGRGNYWQTGSLSERGGVDPFEAVDRFARTVAGRRGYNIAYVPYEIGGSLAGTHHAVHEGDGNYYGYDGAYGAPGAAAYGFGRGGYYDGRWSDSPYARRYSDYRYSPYPTDPRAQYYRHCPDGTLARYTQPCGPSLGAREGSRNDASGATPRGTRPRGHDQP